MDKQQSAPVCDANSSNHGCAELSIEELSKKFNYHYQTFWEKIPKAKVMIQDQLTIATVSKDLVAGLFLKKKCKEILSLALDLSFYVKRTATADSFVYYEVSTFVSSLNEENDSAEVVVNLEPKAWYDQWFNKTLPTANTLEKQFLDLFSKLENNTVITFLIPWLATVLLRLEKRHSSSVASKIIKLFKHAHIMHELRGFNVDEKSSQKLEALLKRFTKVSLVKQKKNALYRAMIEIGRKEKYDRVIRGILDFTSLQTMFCSGMTVFTFINGFHRKQNFLKLSEIIEILSTPDTMTSWKTYKHFLIFLNSLSEEQRYYTFHAREFDSSAFEDLTYAKNMKLCNYFAVLDDIAKLQKRFTKLDYGPTYKQLISNRTDVELLTNDDFRFCANAADDFSRVYPYTTAAAEVVVQMYKKVAQEQQEIADEALKNAQFEQMLADKHRKIAEELEKKFNLGSADAKDEESLLRKLDEFL